MTIGNRHAVEEAEIRALVEEWVQSLRDKDLRGLTAPQSSDVVVFDVKPPIRLQGKEAYTKMWEDCLPYMPGPIDYELRDLTVVAGDDVAFCHSINRMRVKTHSGDTRETWLRATVGFRKIDGEWRIVHEHVSVPFNPMTSQAVLDLKP